METIVCADCRSRRLSDPHRPDGSALRQAAGRPVDPGPALDVRHDTGAIDADQWAGCGFFEISIDYRLASLCPAPAPYQDVQCSIRWVHAHAEEYGLDTARIYLIGMPAGGHMAALAATLGDGRFARTGGWEDQPSRIRAAVCVAGTDDIVSLVWGPDGRRWASRSRSREYASPINQVSADAARLLILHSDNDPSIPVERVWLIVGR